MDCERYRRSVLTDPRDPDPLLRAHLETCGACAQFTQRLLGFEGRLERAMRFPVAPVAPVRPAELDRSRRARAAGRAPRRDGRRRWLAMAASVALAVVVAGGLWLALPGQSLAGDVVEHMAEEPQAWTRTDVPVPPEKLAAVWRDTHVRLGGNAGLVSYANVCGFRKHNVPHLVVQTDQGPITVMVLVHERVARPTPFDEDGYRGVIVPNPGHGSLAVLEKGRAASAADLDEIARRVRGALTFTG